MRLVESNGADAAVRLHSDLGPVRVLGRADLLEQPIEHCDPGRLHGYEIATVLARLASSSICWVASEMRS